jgi:2-iminobutanoate/2-iminopropanoate deaminase
VKKQIFVENGQSHTQGPDAVVANGFAFFAALRGVDPTTGRITTDDPGEQTKFVMENLKQALAAAGCSLDDVVKVMIYMKHWDDRPAFNEVYRTYWSEDQLPARMATQILALGGDERSRFMLDVVAAVPNAS